MNAYKHGGYDANAKVAQRYIQQCRQLLNNEEKLQKLYEYAEDCMKGGTNSPNGSFYPEGVVMAIAELNKLQGYHGCSEAAEKITFDHSCNQTGGM